MKCDHSGSFAVYVIKFVSKSEQQQHQMHTTSRTISSATEVFYCRVCGSPADKIRAGIIACEACKKFFLRNRDNLSAMQCVTNRGDCVIGFNDGNNNNNNNTAANNKRSACSRCRLVKCFSVGMRIKGNVYTKPRSSRGTTTTGQSGQVSARRYACTSGHHQAAEVIIEGENNANVVPPDEDEASIKLVDITTCQSGTSSSSSSTLMSLLPSSSSSSSEQIINNNQLRSNNNNNNHRHPQQQQNKQQWSRDYSTGLTQQFAVSSAGLPVEPVDTERLAVHHTLKAALEAVTELSGFESMPWTIRRDVIRSDHAMWEFTMENFNVAVKSAFSFIRQLPGYNEIPLADRCHLFAGSLIPFVIGQVTLPGSTGTPFFGQNELNRVIFFRCFPNFRNLESVINAAAAAMKTWSPTFIEYALLQALMFYQVDTLPQLTRPDLIVKINSKLKQALRSFYDTNKELYLNYPHFLRVYNLLRQVETVYDVDMYTFANSRPDLIHKNRLFAEMFFLPAEGREKRWYQMNLHALEGPTSSTDN